MADSIARDAQTHHVDLDPASHIYTAADPPKDLITTHLKDPSKSSVSPAKATYGLDSPFGLALSNVAAPLYLYASLKGKFDLWDKLLLDVPKELLHHPTLDIGCGRGLVLLKVAEQKKALGAREEGVAKAYGIDVFVKADQTGNSPLQTSNNAIALGVTAHVALHDANFTEEFPFVDNCFGLVTASLSLHNADETGRKKALSEIIRVCRPGGQLVIADLAGYLGSYRKQLLDAHWVEKDIDISWGGMGVMFGAWPVQVLKATCPMEHDN